MAIYTGHVYSQHWLRDLPVWLFVWIIWIVRTLRPRAHPDPTDRSPRLICGRVSQGYRIAANRIDHDEKRIKGLSGLPGNGFDATDGPNQPGDPRYRPRKGLLETVTITNNPPPDARPVRRDGATHLFAVGQAVRMKVGLGGSTLSSDIYHITGTLPPRGDSPQYRIRNDDERHERVITQESIEPLAVSRSGCGPTLLETTFGRGARTQTQQLHNQDTKEKPIFPKPEGTVGHQVKLAEIPQRGKGKDRRP